MNGSLGAAVRADQVGAQPINSRGDAGQDSTIGQSSPVDEYPGIIVNRHSKLLTTLRILVKECLPSANAEEIIKFRREETVEKFKRHSRILQALVGISPSVLGKVVNFLMLSCFWKPLASY